MNPHCKHYREKDMLSNSTDHHFQLKTKTFKTTVLQMNASYRISKTLVTILSCKQLQDVSKRVETSLSYMKSWKKQYK